MTARLPDDHFDAVNGLRAVRRFSWVTPTNWSFYDQYSSGQR